jgi:hypothetical protein
MIGFFGLDVGPGAISDPTNDCPRAIPVDSITKLARHLNIWHSSKVKLVRNLFSKGEQLSSHPERRDI